MNRFFIKQSEPVIAQRQVRLYRVPIEQIAQEADAASHQFVESFQKLRTALDIYNPALCIMLHEIISTKEAIMGLPSFMQKMDMHLAANPDSVFNIQCSIPTNNLSENILGESYETAHKLYTSNLRQWPEDFLL